MSAARGKRRFFILLCLFGFILFSSLGVWQIERRAWKLDLIARVDARVHAAPVPVPPSAWGQVNPRSDEYRRVQTSGTFLNDRETLVDALTERGAGFWVLTPLRTTSGIILVNRGFVPPERKAPSSHAAAQGTAKVTGLLRMTEPKGRFLRPNRPSEDRWYSRDVAAIAQARGLKGVAPFFIDADATPNLSGYPLGGITVVSFRNMHLVYALTWFGLALLCLIGLSLLRKPLND